MDPRDQFVDLVGNPDDVFAHPFFYRDVDRFIAVKARAAGLFLDAVHHCGHIFQIDGLPVVGGHHQIEDLFRGFELSGYPELVTAVAQGNGAAGDVPVFAGYHPLEHRNGDAVVGELVRIHLDTDLTVHATGDLGFQHPGNRLNVVFKIVGDLFEALGTASSRKGKDDDGHFRKIDFVHRRLIF